jgi:TrmH family RNA methyltransferase
LILVAEAPEKPGNIGAFITADAAHLDAVIIANPKVIYTTPILCVLV